MDTVKANMVDKCNTVNMFISNLHSIHIKNDCMKLISKHKKADWVDKSMSVLYLGLTVIPKSMSVLYLGLTVVPKSMSVLYLGLTVVPKA